MNPNFTSNKPAFIAPAGAKFIHANTFSCNNRLPARRHRRELTYSSAAPAWSMNSEEQSKRRLSLPKVLLLTASTFLSTTFHGFPSVQAASNNNTNNNQQQQNVVNSSKQDLSSSSSVHNVMSIKNNKRKKQPCIASSVISLEPLGIKKEEFLSDRELRRRKTTQFSEAEQEIMELEEWEVDTQWFRDLQAMWAGIFSIGGIFILYRGGVMWEKWIKDQEKKDMEEEIELTGTFIDPRAVRKDEDGGDNNKKGKDNKDNNPPKKPSGSDTPNSNLDDGGPTGDGNDFKQGDIESLEKLFGKS